jgi:hypothetical protein
MTLRQFVLLASASVSSGCTGSLTFYDSHILGGESLELRRNGTFQYESSPDEIGTECNVQGSWRREPRGNLRYIVLEVPELDAAMARNCRHITAPPYWLILRGEFISVGGYSIPRK